MSDFQAALAHFLQALKQPEHSFNDTLSFIDAWFNVTPSAFSFGELVSSSEQNQGSCKILALAKCCSFTKEQALQCFGEHYRQLHNSPASSHLNLRRLEHSGLREIQFEYFPLTAKDTH